MGKRIVCAVTLVLLIFLVILAAITLIGGMFMLHFTDDISSSINKLTDGVIG